MSQITGKQLKVGDFVRAARSSPAPDGKDRELGEMDGVVVEVLPNASKGKVKVLWLSGSVNTHDSCMIVRID